MPYERMRGCTVVEICTTYEYSCIVNPTSTRDISSSPATFNLTDRPVPATATSAQTQRLRMHRARLSTRLYTPKMRAGSTPTPLLLTKQPPYTLSLIHI